MTSYGLDFHQPDNATSRTHRITGYGLFHEIIAWKLRMFVPADESGAGVLARLIERYPLQRIAEREGA